MLAQRRKRGGDLRIGLDGGLARAAGEEHDDVGVRAFRIALDQRKIEIDLAAIGRRRDSPPPKTARRTRRSSRPDRFCVSSQALNASLPSVNARALAGIAAAVVVRAAASLPGRGLK